MSPRPTLSPEHAARDALIRNEVKVSKVLTSAYREVVFTVGKRHVEGTELAHYVRALFPRYELEFVNRWCAQGHCTLDGIVVAGDQALLSGQQVVLHVPLPPPDPTYVVPPLNVIWSDEHLAIVDKPPGHLAHQAGAIMTGTLLNQLQDWALAHGRDPREVRLVNRIDRDTSGIVLVSWHLDAHLALAKSLENRQLHKEYLALCHGVPDPTDGDWREPIGPGDPASIAHVVRPDGRASHTEYHLMERAGGSSPCGYALLRLVLHTGRQHQIRVHASHHGHPLIGDWVYGSACAELPGQALHAAALAVAHPITGKMMRWEAPLPAVFSTLWQRLVAGGTPTPCDLNPIQRGKLGLVAD